MPPLILTIVSVHAAAFSETSGGEEDEVLHQKKLISLLLVAINFCTCKESH